MRNKISVTVTVGLLIGSWVLGGCAKPQMAAISTLEWTRMDSGAHVVDGDRMFYGIGKASGLRNPTLLRATADNEAQAKMARVVESYFRLLTTAAAGAAPQDQGLEQDQIQEIVAVLTESALKRTRISDHRYRESQETLLSLCSIDLSTLKQVIQTAGGLNDAFRQRLLSRADEVYAQFSVLPSPAGKADDHIN